MQITYENNNLTVIGPNWSNPRIIDLTEDEAREVVRVLSSQLTPVTADEGGAVTVIDAIDDPQGLITGKPGRFYPARLRR